MSYTAADVMNRSGALLNDSSLSIFTYAAQIPYLNVAMDELQELFEENNVPATNVVSSVITIAAGVTTLDTAAGLPTNLVEIQMLGERNSGTTDSFIPMTRVDYLPQTAVVTVQLVYWAWIGEVIKFIGATTNRDVELNYIKDLFTTVTTSTDPISLINSKSFLSYRTAALCAEFVGENKERADSLNGDAILALQRTLNISTKGRQAIFTRRRPFMGSYRRRGIIL